MLILPAMILKARFYLPLAKTLHAAGLSAATVDLRAQGESTPPLAEAPNFGYRELVEVDLPAIVDAVSERFPQAPLHLFGHSLGGQVALLFTAAHPDRIASITVIGTGTVYWKAFGPRRWFEALWKIQWIGLVAAVSGRWPGGVLIPGAMAGRVMTDWARHSRTSRYRPHGSARDYDRMLRELPVPVLAISLNAGHPRPEVQRGLPVRPDTGGRRDPLAYHGRGGHRAPRPLRVDQGQRGDRSGGRGLDQHRPAPGLKLPATATGGRPRSDAGPSPCRGPNRVRVRPRSAGRRPPHPRRRR